MNLPKKIQKKLKDLYYTSLPILLPSSKLKVECPFCGWKGESFLPNGVEVRPNARCPKCNSLERHRLYYLYLKNVIPTIGKLKVLHFAPEKILTRLFTSFKNIDYLSADLDPSKGMVKEDVTKISFQDNSFDIIFCSHVLAKKSLIGTCKIANPFGFNTRYSSRVAKRSPGICSSTCEQKKMLSLNFLSIFL